MSITFEKLEGNMAELTITVPAEDFKKACVEAYNKSKNKFQFDGFRKGHVPMAFIEKTYGPAVFFEDAANDLINKTYYEEIKDIELDIVSNPEISLSQIEKGKDFIYKAKVATKPPVELGDLSKLEIEKVDAEVTDEDVEKEIERKLKENSTKNEVTDRAAKDGDETTINFEGFVDGVAFEGGKGEKYPLVLGSGSFIPGFEDQIVGHSIGDSFDVNVTFPENYQAENLAGKEAEFKIKLHELKEKELPELDDDFVKDVSEKETVDEYKAELRTQIEARLKDEAQKDIDDQIATKLIDLAQGDIPEAMYENQVNDMMRDFEMRLRQQGMNIDMKTYMQYMGMEESTVREMYREEAEKKVKLRLALQSIAAKENIEVTEADIEDEYSKMAEAYKMDVKQVKAAIPADSLSEDIKVQKALDIVKNSAVIK